MLKLWLLTCCSNCSSHYAQQSHTRSISQPNPKICNLVSTTHKECWGELAGQENTLGSSGMPGNQHHSKERAEGINTPLSKTSRCSVSTDRSDRLPRPVRPVGSNKLAVGPRPVRSVRTREPQNPVYKTPLDPSSQHLIIQLFLS